jgi:cyclopropane-fatty-acyl-phospholipid synthase
MTIDTTGTFGTTADHHRWSGLARVPRGPLSGLSGLVADGLLRRAVARLPLRRGRSG